MRFGLGRHPVDAPEQVEIIHVGAAQEILQRFKDAGQRNAQGFHLFPIHVDGDPRRAGLERGKKDADLRPYPHFGDERLRSLRKLVDIAAASVFQHELESAGGAEAWDRWNVEGQRHGLDDPPQLAP